MTRVAITGAGGFIGAHVVRALGKQASALHLGPPGDLDLTQRLRALDAWSEHVRVVRARLDDVAALATLFADAGVVVHLAGPPSVAESFAAPEQCLRTHVEGTAHVLEAC